MSRLVLVRHGQATAFEADSDRLTALGEEQARLLGAWWARQRMAFTEVYTGTLERQRRTAQLAAGCAEAAGLRWPAAVEMPEFNEYDVDGVMHRLIPELARGDAAIAGLLTAFEAHRGGPEQNRHFQRVFEAAMTRWFEDSPACPAVEPWGVFRGRVCQALERILEIPGSGRQALVVTSGGPIGVMVQTLLGAPEAQALALNWRVRNTAVTEFLFGDGRVSLDLFNATPHLAREAQISYR
jgi:broad specificity phosphatase PhoE